MDIKLDTAGTQVLRIAKREARSLYNKYAGTEHLLLGILSIKASSIDNIFKRLNIDIKDIKQVIYENIYQDTGVKKPDMESKSIQFTPRVDKILQIAQDCATKLGRRQVSPEHIFLGLLYEQNGVAINVLKSFGISFRRVKKEFHNHLDGVDKIPKQALDRLETAQTLKNEFKKFKVLGEHSTNLTILAKEGKLDTVVGREPEVNKLMQILCRKTKNNPALIGEAGVGKTAIVELLAQKIAAGDVPAQLLDKHIVALDIASLVAGTKYRGQFEERMKKILLEVKSSSDIIIFIDEIHTIVNAGAASGTLDVGNIFKPALSRGQLSCIGATTAEEYVKHIEANKALDRRFQTIKVLAPTASEALVILKGIRSDYEKYHKVRYTTGALKAAVELSERYLCDKSLPDSAIDVIDEAGAKRKLEGTGENTITQEDIENIITANTGVPIISIDSNTSKFYKRLERNLKKEIIGQDEALEKVCMALKRSQAHLNDPDQPVGSFLFLGTTGVGKTYLCKLLSKYLFGGEQKMIRIDMSEFMESHSISKITGSPPGYVGHGDSNKLLEKVRKNPYSLVLFDEIEKAHPQVLDILLQLLDEGHLTDSQGRDINFKNTIIVMTSNLGSGVLDIKQIGFGDNAPDNFSEIKAAAVKDLKPEFVNRIDEITVFNRLSSKHYKSIANLQFKVFADRVKDNYKINVTCADDVIDFIVDSEDIKKYGAREIKRNFRRLVENNLAELLVNNKAGETDIEVFISDNIIKFRSV